MTENALKSPAPTNDERNFVVQFCNAGLDVFCPYLTTDPSAPYGGYPQPRSIIAAFIYEGATQENLLADLKLILGYYGTPTPEASLNNNIIRTNCYVRSHDDSSQALEWKYGWNRAIPAKEVLAPSETDKTTYSETEIQGRINLPDPLQWTGDRCYSYPTAKQDINAAFTAVMANPAWDIVSQDTKRGLAYQHGLPGQARDFGLTPTGCAGKTTAQILAALSGPNVVASN